MYYAERERRIRVTDSIWSAWLLGLALLLGACAPEVVRRNHAGNQHFTQGAYDEAIAEYRLAQVDDPDQPEPYYNAANSFSRKAQLEETVTQARQALKTAGPDLAAQTWYNLGNTHFEARDWRQAIGAYQESLRIKPHDLDAKHNLELALLKLEEEQQEQTQHDQNDQQDQASKEPDQPSPDGSTPTATGPSGTAKDQEPLGGTPTPDAGEGDAYTMTEEQALQLLDALVGDGNTLQEQLQRIFRAPGPPPDRDW